MALTARDRRVFSGQCEGGAAMIKCGGSPAVGRMAGSAVRSKPAGVRIGIAVTGGAIGGRAFELQIGVTVTARHADMLAGQFEDGIVVIKTARLPVIGRMAGFTLCAQTAAMRIGIAVTGGAVHGRAFEDTVDMTAFANHLCMFPVQMEGEQGVIHSCQFPAFGGVTGSTVGSKLTVVMVIL